MERGEIKLHTKDSQVLVHALDLMKRCQGIGDMLEDDVEHIHQMAVRIEMHTSRMPNKAQQPFIHSKIEAIQNSTDVKMKIELSQQCAKRVFKRRNSEKDSTMKRTKIKIERDQTWIEALEEIETKHHASLAPIKFKSK
jgi:hypothetical protein